ncbi:tex protein [Spirochaetia bacterium]|nr:tex protein [Spirochaetia bacterium]GHU33558.1 tex protein [Spirochaetia bacterium]
MELNQEYIDQLKIDESVLIVHIADTLNIKPEQAAAAVHLLAEGSTVPFIARYRKEKTGNLDEVQVRDIAHLFSSGKNLETRRLDIIRLIFDQGKLTEPLCVSISQAATLTELEDLYAPYKHKKKTRAMLAIEKGLEPLAQIMQTEPDEIVQNRANAFINDSVTTIEEALQGAADIIAEQVAQNPAHRAAVKTLYETTGRIVVKGIGDENAKKTSIYQMYWDFTESFSQIKAHRILAINRGEREKVLDVSFDVEEAAAVEMLQKRYIVYNNYHKNAIEDAVKRLLSPQVKREIRGEYEEKADIHGIGVFSVNLKNLLMQQPIRGTRVMGIDPGIRTGSKCAFLDDTGKYLGHIVFYNHKPEDAKTIILEGIRKYDIQLIAIGNGTGSLEVRELVSEIIATHNLTVPYTVVDEDGASVYSASNTAREEFPELDLTIRGAISIGRRLQDPLAELVKIDPKSIGVGLYQHDVNQRKLSETLDEVVSSVVNNVGVNLNTASVSLLRYVSGINSGLARKIVQYRESKGTINSRQELITVPGMGPKSFEQCAGFLKIPESPEPLDNTWVHPENYEIARMIQQTLTTTGNVNAVERNHIQEIANVGTMTISDIVEELKKPNRDPREQYPKPVLQTAVVKFEDLYEGMMITGKIKNVVDFGAFVDVGLKETALVHISQLSDRFIQDPLEAVKVGDVMEFRIIALDSDRRRISLSRKKTEPVQPDIPKKKIIVIKKPETPKKIIVKKTDSPQKNRQIPPQPAPFKKNHPVSPDLLKGSEDGTRYNPFALLFNKEEGNPKK